MAAGRAGLAERREGLARAAVVDLARAAAVDSARVAAVDSVRVAAVDLD